MGAPELTPVVEAGSQTDGTRSTVDTTPSSPVVVTSAFPHGEHRAIRCATCHVRVPGHVTHQGVECTDCHGTPEAYGTLPIRSRDDCLSCHHGPAAEQGCARCHGSGPTASIPVQVALQLSSATPVRERTLDFRHDWHGSLDCGACHEGGVHNPVGRTCASCHDRHHTATARCLECHEPPRALHQTSAHLGCGGSSCHDDPEILALPETRAVCLVCHDDRREHEAPKECTTCHFTGRPGGGRAAGAGSSR